MPVDALPCREHGLPGDRLSATWVTRRASVADAGELTLLFESVYRNSSHPFQSVRDVEEFLRDDRNFEVVVSEGNRILAGAAMTYFEWNDSYELGRAITQPEAQRNGLAALLMRRAVGEVCSRGLGSVFFGFPRVRRIAEIGSCLEPRFVTVGHDAGRNVVNAERETHLIIYALPHHRRFQHVTAPLERRNQPKFLLDEVYGSLGVKLNPGAYPPEAIVGYGHNSKCVWQGFVLDDSGASPSGRVEILGDVRREPSARSLGVRLQRLLRKLPRSVHTTITVLADKIDLVRELCDIGFRITAFLPAWYPSGESRYDCIQMVRTVGHVEPVAQGFQDIVERVSQGLEGIVDRGALHPCR